MKVQRFFLLMCIAQVVIGAICANVIGLVGLVLALLMLFIPVIGVTLSSVSIYFLGPIIEETVRCKLVGAANLFRVGFGVCYSVGFWFTERAVALKGKVSLTELQKVAHGDFTDLNVTFADMGISALLIHAGLTYIAVYSYRQNQMSLQPDFLQQFSTKLKSDVRISFIFKLSLCHLTYNVLLFLVISLGNYSAVQQQTVSIIIALVCLAILVFNLRRDKSAAAYVFRTTD